MKILFALTFFENILFINDIMASLLFEYFKKYVLSIVDKIRLSFRKMFKSCGKVSGFIILSFLKLSGKNNFTHNKKVVRNFRNSKLYKSLVFST